MTQKELQSRTKHILSYGENWGFVHVREQIKWRERAIKDHEWEARDYRKEVKAFKQLLKRMEEKRKKTKEADSQ